MDTLTNYDQYFAFVFITSPRNVKKYSKNVEYLYGIKLKKCYLEHFLSLQDNSWLKPIPFLIDSTSIESITPLSIGKDSEDLFNILNNHAATLKVFSIPGKRAFYGFINTRNLEFLKIISEVYNFRKFYFEKRDIENRIVISNYIAIHFNLDFKIIEDNLTYNFNKIKYFEELIFLEEEISNILKIPSNFSLELYKFLFNDLAEKKYKINILEEILLNTPDEIKLLLELED